MKGQTLLKKLVFVKKFSFYKEANKNCFPPNFISVGPWFRNRMTCTRNVVIFSRSCRLR